MPAAAIAIPRRRNVTTECFKVYSPTEQGPASFPRILSTGWRRPPFRPALRRYRAILGSSSSGNTHPRFPMLSDSHHATIRRRGTLSTLIDWLRDVPVLDAIERRHAPVLQILMVFILTTLPANWCYHLLVVRAPTRRDVTVDLAADVFVWIAALGCLLMIRRGQVRRAMFS